MATSLIVSLSLYLLLSSPLLFFQNFYAKASYGEFMVLEPVTLRLKV